MTVQEDYNTWDIDGNNSKSIEVQNYFATLIDGEMRLTMPGITFYLKKKYIL